MEKASGPRVLIRTLPLSNGNYGGVLQAFALQTTLKDLGAVAVTDATRADRTVPTAARRLAKRVGSGLPLVSARVPASWRRETLQRNLAAPTDEFARRNIAQVRVFDRQRALPDVVKSFDVFIAGSDQVWRSAYGDVPSFMFDFVESGTARITSYAASFGLGDLDEYGSELRSRTRELAQRFDAISVREDDGIAICQRDWGVEAERHVDPTMLVPLERYRSLARETGAPRAANGTGLLLDYVLDQSEEAGEAVSAVVKATGLRRRSLMPPTPASLAEWNGSRARYIRPSVGEWLTSIADSEFVVTDSFHGTVFSILNRRPFVVIANHKRGTSRLDTLLGLFGLSDRLVDPTERASGAIERIVGTDIAWDVVDKRLDEERSRGVDFLRAQIR